MLRLTHFNYRKVVTTPCGSELEDSIGFDPESPPTSGPFSQRFIASAQSEHCARTLGSGPAQRFTESFRRNEMKKISLKIRLLFVVAGMMLAVIAPSRLLAQPQTAASLEWLSMPPVESSRTPKSP